MYKLTFPPPSKKVSKSEIDKKKCNIPRQNRLNQEFLKQVKAFPSPFQKHENMETQQNGRAVTKNKILLSPSLPKTRVLLNATISH